MTCREVIEFLMDYTSGELPHEVRAEFERHLELCPPCVAYLHTYEQTRELARHACISQDKPVDADVPEELVRAILAARAAERR